MDSWLKLEAGAFAVAPAIVDAATAIPAVKANILKFKVILLFLCVSVPWPPELPGAYRTEA